MCFNTHTCVAKLLYSVLLANCLLSVIWAKSIFCRVLRRSYWRFNFQKSIANNIAEFSFQSNLFQNITETIRAVVNHPASLIELKHRVPYFHLVSIAILFELHIVQFYIRFQTTRLQSYNNMRSDLFPLAFGIFCYKYRIIELLVITFDVVRLLCSILPNYEFVHIMNQRINRAN